LRRLIALLSLRFSHKKTVCCDVGALPNGMLLPQFASVAFLVFRGDPMMSDTSDTDVPNYYRSFFWYWIVAVHGLARGHVAASVVRQKKMPVALSSQSEN